MKKLAKAISISFLIIILGALVSCHMGPSSQEMLAKAQRFIDQGQYHKAFWLLKKLKKDRSGDERVWFMLGEVALRSGHPYQAIRYFETVLSLNPQNSRALVKLGYLYLVTGYYEKARYIAKKILKIDPQNVYAHLILGDLKALKGNLDQARKYFQKVQAQQPKDFRCYLELGDFYLLSGDYQLALRAYKKAQLLAPQRPEVYIALGNYYLVRKQWSQAEKALEKAISLTPPKSYQRLDYQAYLAEFFIKTRQIQRAFTLYQKLLQKEPHNYYFLVRYTEIALYLRDLDKAQKSLVTLKRYYPELFAVPYLQGHLLLAKGHYKDALASFQVALSRAEDPRAYYFLGLSQWLSGLPRQALTNLSQAVLRDPLLLKARLALAALELSTNQPALAYKDLQWLLPYSVQAHKLALMCRLKLRDCQNASKEWFFLKSLPSIENKDFLTLLWEANCATIHIPKGKKLPLAAWVLFRNKPEAITHLLQGPPEALKALKVAIYMEKSRWEKVEKALESDTSSVTLAYLKAVLLNRQGEYQKAIPLLQHVTQTVPDFVPAQTLLGHLYFKTHRYLKAAESFRQALVHAPQNPLLLNDLAWTLLQMPRERGTLEEALKVAEEARDLAPEDPAVVDTLALVYHYSDMHEIACRTAKRALELAPQDPLIKQHKALVCQKELDLPTDNIEKDQNKVLSGRKGPKE